MFLKIQTRERIRICVLMREKSSMHARLDEILKHYVPFESSDYTITRSYLFDKYRRNRQIQERYQQEMTRNVDICLGIISQQWPCERPELPEGSVPGLLDRKAVIEDCSKLFTRWYRNSRFFTFLQQVQDRLNALPFNDSRNPPVKPLPLPPTNRLVRKEPPFEPPTLLKLICSSEPPSEPTGIAPIECHRKSILQAYYCPERNAEVRTLLKGSLDSQNIYHREYKYHLLECLSSLQNSRVSLQPTEIPLTRGILVNHQSHLRSQRDSAWSDIVSNLIGTTDVWKALGGATLWP